MVVSGETTEAPVRCLEGHAGENRARGGIYGLVVGRDDQLGIGSTGADREATGGTGGEVRLASVKQAIAVLIEGRQRR